MAYFTDVKTLEELRGQYKDLLKRHHPDNPGGSTGAAQQINGEYSRLFGVLKDRREKKTQDGRGGDKAGFDGMKYNPDDDWKFREALQGAIHFTGVNIEIIGCWIWVDGDTYGYRGRLKGLGYKWAREKKKWYFHTGGFRKKSGRKFSMEEIRRYYGSAEVGTEDARLLKA